CTFIAAANPKKGKFSIADSLVDQIDLPKPLIDRFDLIMPFVDTVGKDDIKLANKIGEIFQGKDTEEDIIESDLLRNYIFYSRTFNPVLSKEATIKLNKYWVMLRASSVGCSSNISISARHLNALNRLSRCSAKFRLSNKVNLSDAENSIDLFNHFIKKMGLQVLEPVKEEKVKK
ncbi:unnamed protein product, partial [marine sediment metagenome]